MEAPLHEAFEAVAVDDRRAGPFLGGQVDGAVERAPGFRGESEGQGLGHRKILPVKLRPVDLLAVAGC